MPVPKKKHTRSRSGKRRGGKKAKLPALSICASCKKLKIPHRTCPGCGQY